MMKRNFTAIIIFVAMLMLGSALFGQVQVPPAVYVAAKSMVEIQSGNAGGTGAILNMGPEHQHIHVLTAAHVISNGGPYSVEFQGSKKKFPAILRTSDRQNDIAFLQVQRTSETAQLAKVAVPIRSTNPNPGELFFYGGYAYNGPKLVSGKLYRKSSGEYIVDGTSISGMSGGPVFDQYGNIVSNLWGYRNSDGKMLMSSNEAMKKLLVSRYGYGPLQRSAAPINFPESMPYAQPINNPAQPRMDIQIPQQLPQQQAPQPQYVMPQPMPQPRQQILQHLLQQGSLQVPYRIYAEFDPAMLQLQQHIQLQPQIQSLPVMPQTIPVQPQQPMGIYAPR